MTAAGPKFELTASRQFTAWLADQCVSLAFTTYQTGKLLLIGLRPDGRLSVFERTFNRCMGLWASPQTLYMSSLYQLWRFDNALESGQVHNGYDRLYVPQLGYTTSNLDIHDIAVDGGGRVIFVNTMDMALEGGSTLPRGINVSRKIDGQRHDLITGDRSFSYVRGRPFDVAFTAENGNYHLVINGHEPLYLWNQWRKTYFPATPSEIKKGAKFKSTGGKTVFKKA